MESKVNPRNDRAIITARHIVGNERKYFVLPENLSAEERKEYPLLIKDELTTRFKEQINRRIISHMRRENYDNIGKL